MSADLFEAFGKAEDPPQKIKFHQQPTAAGTTSAASLDFSRPPSQTDQSQFTSSTVTRIEPIFSPGDDGGNDVLFDATVEEGQIDEDDFGDFEDVNEGQSPTRAPAKYADALPIAQSARTNHEEHLVDLLSLDEDPTPPQFQSTNPPSTTAVGPDLFAIPNNSSPLQQRGQVLPQVENDDDGWGDFEAFESFRETTSPPARLPKQSKVPPKSPRKQTVSPQKPPIKPKPIIQPLNPSKAVPSEIDEWDSFQDGPPPKSPPAKPTPTSTTNTDNTAQINSSIPPPSELQRPTNIPPPAILLSLLPATIQSLVNLILNSPSSDSAQFPSLIHWHHRLTSRLVSTPVRLLRWRRDTILAQSTRISIAARSTNTSSSGGMKLSSVNKGESIREEREAAEAIEVWNRNLHHFSKVISTAKSKVHPVVAEHSAASTGPNKGLKVSMNMPVKVLTGPGAIQSALVCPLCGLKRSERVVGTDDIGVDDVFGEYWLENWGHRDCAEWWYRWKVDLSQR